MYTANQSLVDLYKSKSSDMFPDVVNLFIFQEGYFVEGDRMKWWRFDSNMRYKTSLGEITGHVFTVYNVESKFFAN